MSEQNAYLISSTIISSWVSAAISQGFSLDDILGNTNIDKEVLSDMDKYVSLEFHDALLDKLLPMVGDEYLGLHIGSQLTCDSFGLFGYIFKTSKTVNEGVVNLMRYINLITNIATYKLEVVDNTAVFGHKFFDPNIKYKRQINDYGLAATVALLNSILYKKLDILEVNFSHEKPSNEEEYKRYFNCRINYCSDYAELKFDADILDLSTTGSSPELNSTLLKHADLTLRNLSIQNNLISSVRKHLVTGLEQNSFTLEKTASALNLTPRTLQRRLDESNVKYSEVLNEVRKELAVQHLAMKELTSVDIAYLLGYSESASFLRAFKRWYGVTPSEYRKQI